MKARNLLTATLGLIGLSGLPGSFPNLSAPEPSTPGTRPGTRRRRKPPTLPASLRRGNTYSRYRPHVGARQKARLVKRKRMDAHAAALNPAWS